MYRGDSLTSALVVEDDPRVRGMIEKWLQRNGTQVHVAADGVEALRLLQQGRVRPDVILLDAEMPHMDGFSLLRRIALQPELAAIPCVMMSGGDPAWASLARSLGAVDFLPKPFGPSGLFATLAPYVRATSFAAAQSA